MVADIFDEELEMLLSEDAADKGPGFGWTSPEQSNIMFNHKANSMTPGVHFCPDISFA